MSVSEDILIAKIKRGERIADVRKWFVEEQLARPRMWADMSPFEQAFMNQIAFAYEAWCREQEENAR